MKRIKTIIAAGLLLFASNSFGVPASTKYVKQEYATRDEFIQRASEEAIKLKARYDIPIAVTVSMAIYESRYGQSTLGKQHNNYFGIKAYSWKGKFVELKTRDSGRVVIAKFRSYDSLEEGFDDFGKFLQKSLYRKAFVHDDPIKFLREILKAGYCPSPSYLADIKKIIKLYDLSIYDI